MEETSTHLVARSEHIARQAKKEKTKCKWYFFTHIHAAAAAVDPTPPFCIKLKTKTQSQTHKQNIQSSNDQRRDDIAHTLIVGDCPIHAYIQQEGKKKGPTISLPARTPLKRRAKDVKRRKQNKSANKEKQNAKKGPYAKKHLHHVVPASCKHGEHEHVRCSSRLVLVAKGTRVSCSP